MIDLHYRTGLTQELQLSSAGLQSESLAKVTLHEVDYHVALTTCCSFLLVLDKKDFFLFPFLNVVIKSDFLKKKSLTAKEHVYQVLTEEWKLI